MINYELLVAGVFWAKYSYISERVVQLLAPPTNPALHLREKFFINHEKPSYGCQQCVHKYYGSVELGLQCQLG